MFMRSGVCNKQKRDHSSHPLLHVMAHGGEYDDPPLVITGKTDLAWRRTIVEACEEIRGRPYIWMTFRRKQGGGSYEIKKFIKWARTNEPLTNWAKCDHSFVAPSRWPLRVHAAFAPYPVPTPYRTANSELSVLGAPYRTHEAAALIAYAFGVRVRTMAEWFEVAPEIVVRQMAEGVQKLKKDPRFKIWLARIDWSTMYAPPELGDGMLARFQKAREIRNKPLRIPHGLADTLVKSPSFVAWACSDKAKRVDPFWLNDFADGLKDPVAPPGTGS